MPRSRLIALSAALAAALVLLPGCKVGGTAFGGNGVSKLPPQQILERAKSAAAAAASVRVKGRLVSGGQPVSIDMRVMQGQQASGVISMGPNTITLVRSGAAVYVKGSDGFYRSIGIRKLPKQLKGKYLKVEAGGDQFAGLAEFTDIERIFDMFLDSPAPISKGKKQKFNGVRTIALQEQGGAGRTVLVALQGEPWPLRISPPAAAGDGVDFLEYNQPFTVQPPAQASVVDINRLVKAAA